MEDEMEDKDIKGAFVSYVENTGRGTIYPGTYDEYLTIKKIRAGIIFSPDGPELPLDLTKDVFSSWSLKA